MYNFTKVFLLLALVVVFNNQVVTGKKFKSECAIAKELLKHGFPKDQLNDCKFFFHYFIFYFF